MTSETVPPIPHLPRLPVFGNLLDFRRRRLDFLLELTRRCGDISEVYFASWPVLVLNAAELADVVLVHEADKFEKSPMLSRHLRPILGDGLLTIEMARHAAHRRRVAPAFQHRRLAAYAETMVRYTEQTLAPWNDGQVVDITEAMQALTLRIVGTTLFGTDLLTEAAATREALQGIQRYANTVFNAVVDIPFSWPLPRNVRAKRALAQIDTTVDHILQERSANRGDRGDVLSILFNSEETPSPAHLRYVRDEVRTLVLAGHETTAVALIWTWYLLTQHQAVYRQLQDEIDRTIGSRTPTYDDIAKVPLALRVIKESMRLYPPVYAFARSAAQHVQLTPTFTIPSGRSVLISTYTLHRRADYFTDPERFDPERWTPDNEAKLPRSAYLPFGAGPRGCIGQHFALMEAQLILITLAQQVTFERVPGPGVGLDPLMTLRPNRSIQLRVQRRT